MRIILQLRLSPWLWVKSCYFLANILLVYFVIASYNMVTNNSMIAKDVKMKYSSLF